LIMIMLEFHTIINSSSTIVEVGLKNS